MSGVAVRFRMATKATSIAGGSTIPNIQFMFWNEDNIDFAGVPTLNALYEAKKFNKVSDVVRHKAILDHGGIYLDTDVRRVFVHLTDC